MQRLVRGDVFAGGGYLHARFNYEVFALALAGFGTLALAVATHALVRQADEHEQEERDGRPVLSLLSDVGAVYSYAENETTIYIRLLVRNAVGKRASTGTRVLFDSLMRPGEEKPVTFGTPYLGWTSAHAADEFVVIFAGATRVIDLGELRVDVKHDPTRDWGEFKILLPGLQDDVPNRRQYVGTGTPILLVVGSDEAETRFYNVTVGWGWGGGGEVLASDILKNHVGVQVAEVEADDPLPTMRP